MSDPIASPAPILASGLPLCAAPATVLVFRGRTRRLYLCDRHRAFYRGSGSVVPYRGVAEWRPGQVSEVAREFIGPPRRCGEEVS